MGALVLTTEKSPAFGLVKLTTDQLSASVSNVLIAAAEVVAAQMKESSAEGECEGGDRTAVA